MTSPTTLHSANGEGLDLPGIFAALSDHFTVASGAKRFVRSARLDTFDRRLRAVGLGLEHQRFASHERLVLSRGDGSSIVTVPVTGQRWPAFAGILPGPVRDLIVSVTGIRALLVTSDQRRRVQQLELQDEEGKTVARVELDEPASPGSAPAQLTVRTMRGYEEQARRVSRLLAGLGHGVVDRDEGEDPGPAPAAAMDRLAPATLLLWTALSDFLDTMRENLPGLLDDVDTEFLHDFRVAVRRTRATLKLGRSALPTAIGGSWEPAFKGLGDLTTPLRDLDVYELDLPTMTGWLVAADPTDLEPFVTHLRARRGIERRALVRRLRSASFRRLVKEWGEELAQLGGMPEGADHERLSAGELADSSISRAYRRVVRGGAAISGSSAPEELHTLRKRCKELRYALEVCAPVVAQGPRKRMVAELKSLQDVLGRFQDSDVQRRGLRGFAEEMMADGTPASAVLAMGELIGHLDAEQDRARREFGDVFARFARPSSRRLMDQLGGRA
ncbi:MAG: CHAD domain-containing protein [Actinomycetota bacterium]